MLDEESLLACAAYVDLNPIRAAIAQTLETSDFTSVQRRIASMTAESGCDRSSPAFLAPVQLDQRVDAIGPCTNGPCPSTNSPCPNPSGPCPSTSGHRCSDKGFLGMSLEEYLPLLDWTARQHVSGKRGSTPENVPPIFTRLAIRPDAWCELASDFGRLFGVVAGQPHRIDEHRSRRQHRPYRSRRRTRELLNGN